MSQQELQFSPVETGNLSEIPPDAPPGEWVAACNVKITATQKDNAPMLVLEYRLEECLTPENSEFPLPTRVTRFLVIRGANHQYVKMFRQDLAAICAGHGIPVPNLTRIASSADLQPFADELMANRLVVKTVNKTEKTGEVRTNVTYPKKAAESNVEEPSAEGGKKRRRG